MRIATLQETGTVGIARMTWSQGAMGAAVAQMGRLAGMVDPVRFAIEWECRMCRVILDSAPEASTEVEMVIVVQNEPAGGSVADCLGLPFVSTYTSLLLNREPLVSTESGSLYWADHIGTGRRHWRLDVGIKRSGLYLHSCGLQFRCDADVRAAVEQGSAALL